MKVLVVSLLFGVVYVGASFGSVLVMVTQLVVVLDLVMRTHQTRPFLLHLNWFSYS